ncbi:MULTISPECIES: UvrD-helicase domain-containing protein [unclassified Microcystis]|jgi:DNA helicase-4|uniref:UvrD-helicase domain-containing protein n=1 Tax=unclassified Microcystis TaxID=2643300 RepID=UPI0022BD5698|nr:MULTISPECIES: UvrD-helicase domain-containing protein [unclassified Microcystis]MCA2691648.1 UvrD-helicase domain-containing protein [Microcystis sp. M034S2]MCA2752192.1 UvrD-helicase domain-containing protein [Microcystis sp. M144S2]MCZ8201263.1 UvrD-helicase domain-containing protein [Microcystis sp. LE19-55.1A]MCZ8306424.1 UvrD-helicase domain-containing protein [Microcystis sp. LE19-98.1E]
MDNSNLNKQLVINNIQEFAELVGNYDQAWKLLVGKKVSRIREEVKYKGKKTGIKGTKNYKYGQIINIKYEDDTVSVHIKYQHNFFAEYRIEKIINQFSDIFPFITVQEIFQKVPEIKNKILQDIYQKLEYDFLNVNKLYQERLYKYLTKGEFWQEKHRFVQSWLEKNLGRKPDLEQSLAIGEVNNNIQVLARAGSGKTSTLVNKALFLQKHCGILPREILILAFNRKAAEEIRERIEHNSLNNIPYVMTFHALAYGLVHPEEELIFDQSGGEQRKSKALQSVIDDHLKSPQYFSKIRDLMMAKFRGDWENLVRGGHLLNREEMLSYRRSLPREGLDGRYYKSFGEKVIANFLFEHNLFYSYERNYDWNGINYRPDFTIFTGKNQGIIIEYFGLQGDPDYDEMSARKRQFWQNAQNQARWQFLEFNPQDIKAAQEQFGNLLKHKIESFGLLCNRLSEDEIWAKVKRRSIDHFTKAMVQFVQRCRQQFLTTEELENKIFNHNCLEEFESQFLELGQVFYRAYLERLKATGEEDFDGLMQTAAKLITSGQTIFRRKSGVGDLSNLKYILIDEYQDFSELFYRLITAIRKQNSQAWFFCVGDDWQAINGFAGSDLNYYQNFANYFPNSLKLNISTNYRSASAIVTTGNNLMNGLGKPAQPHKKESGFVKLVDLQDFEPTPREIEDHNGDHITPALLRLIKKIIIENNQEVVLLNRKNNLHWFVNDQNKLEDFLNAIRGHLPENLRDHLTISTSHKYKGLEKQVVIILDAVNRSYPLIHPDWVFTRIFGSHPEGIVAEERRLFYVAITRAIEQLYIITESPNYSPFLAHLNLNKINWQEYPIPGDNSKYITIEIGNQKGKGSHPTIQIRDLLKAQGYKWNSHQHRQIWYRHDLMASFTTVDDFFHQSSWYAIADGVEVCFYDDFRNLLCVCHVNNGQHDCLKAANIELYSQDLDQ